MTDQHREEGFGRRELALGRPRIALQHLIRALENQQDRLDLALEIARIQYGLGEYVEAAERCESIIDRPFKHREAVFRVLIYSLLNSGRPERVRQVARQALDVTGEPWFVSIALQVSNACDDLTATELMEAHRRGGEVIRSRIGKFVAVEPGPKRNGPIRVGILSGDLVEHPVTRFLEPTLAAFDRSRFHFCVFSNTIGSDATTARLRLLSSAWHDVSNLADDGCAAMIRDARLDILLDLGGHMFTGRPGVLARRPAPVMATWLGYPNTTGLTEVDWRIVDAITDPPERSWATEQLMRIEPPFLCYRGPDLPTPCKFPLRERGIVFGSFNNLVKLSPTCLRLWGEVLLAVPDSRLILKTRGLECPRTRAWIESRFMDEGVSRDRLDLRAWCDGLTAHYDSYADVDIALDTFPYNGTTTTCDAIWSGVPVVSRVGEDHRSRVGATLLNAVGLADLAADNDTEFRAAAVRLAEDHDRRSRLRMELRNRVLHGPLGDVRSFADRLGRAIECMCDRPAAADAAVDSHPQGES